MKMLPLLLFLPLLSFGQDKSIKKKGSPPYLTITPGILKFEKSDIIPFGAISFGAKIKDAGIGFGAAINKFQGDKEVFVPIFGELSIMPQKRKIAPYFNFRAGSAIYRNKTAVSETRAGFYSAINFGIGIPTGKSGTGKMLFGVGYAHPTLITEVAIRGRTETSSTALGGFAFFFGALL